MPEFNTHLVGGILTGTAVGAWGFFQHQIGPVHAGAVAVLGTLGGLLPDLDSDSGKPLDLLFQIISVLLPVLLYPYVFHGRGHDVPLMLCYYAGAYLLINYAVMPLVKKATRHRGMMHSLPFALVSGEGAFLLLLPSGRLTAIYGGLSVMAGCLVHLVLDQIASMGQRSSGGAMKLKGPHLLGTLFVYGMLVVMGVAVAARLFPAVRPFLRSLPTF